LQIYLVDFIETYYIQQIVTIQHLAKKKSQSLK